jgi:hypothetical protein
MRTAHTERLGRKVPRKDVPQQPPPIPVIVPRKIADSKGRPTRSALRSDHREQPERYRIDRGHR